MDTSIVEVWFATHIPPDFGLYSGLWIVIVADIDCDNIVNAMILALLYIHFFIKPFGKKPIRNVVITIYST